MALTTYEGLKTAIKSYEDDESASVVDMLDDMISLAEQRIFMGGGRYGDPLYTAPLRIKGMERKTVVPIGPSLDGGMSAGTANAQTVSISPTLVRGVSISFRASLTNTSAFTLNAVAVKKGPNKDALVADDILQGEEYTVYHDGTEFVLMPSDGAAPLPSRWLGHKTAMIVGQNKPLTFATNLSVNGRLSVAGSGVPYFFTIESNCFRFDPAPTANYSVQMTYYQKPLPLSAAVNDILREAPGIYLFGSLYELNLYLQNPEGAGKYFAQFRNAIDGYAQAQEAANTTFGPMYVNLGGVP